MTTNIHQLERRERRGKWFVATAILLSISVLTASWVGLFSFMAATTAHSVMVDMESAMQTTRQKTFANFHGQEVSVAWEGCNQIITTQLSRSTESGDAQSPFSAMSHTSVTACVAADDYLAVGSADGTVTVWGLDDRCSRMHGHLHLTACTALAFSETNVLIAGGADGACFLYDVAAGEHHKIDLTKLDDVFGPPASDDDSAVVRIVADEKLAVVAQSSGRVAAIDLGSLAFLRMCVRIPYAANQVAAHSPPSAGSVCLQCALPHAHAAAPAGYRVLICLMGWLTDWRASRFLADSAWMRHGR